MSIVHLPVLHCNRKAEVHTNDLDARCNTGIEISIPALQRAPKPFCMYFRLQRNAGKDVMLAEACIVNLP